MIAMMEKYANNLEALVDERTDQLQQEKRKTGNDEDLVRNSAGVMANDGMENLTLNTSHVSVV